MQIAFVFDSIFQLKRTTHVGIEVSCQYLILLFSRTCWNQGHNMYHYWKIWIEEFLKFSKEWTRIQDENAPLPFSIQIFQLERTTHVGIKVSCQYLILLFSQNMLESRSQYVSLKKFNRGIFKIVKRADSNQDKNAPLPLWYSKYMHLQRNHYNTISNS
jgi:hypothetical protein